MYKKVLAVITEHTSSEIAGRYAITFAATAQAKLILFHTAADIKNEAFKRAEAHMERLFVKSAEAGITVERITEKGALSDMLAQQVKDHAIDVVFFPLTRRHAKPDSLDNVSMNTLIRKIPAAIAFVHVIHMGRPHPHRILVPLAGTIRDCRSRSLFVALMARGFNSDVTLFHMTRSMKSFLGRTQPSGGSDVRSRLTADITHFSRLLHEHGIKTVDTVGSGAVGRGITVEAATRHADLIIAGASERGFIDSVLRGNPVSEILREAPCNVIVLKAASR